MTRHPVARLAALALISMAGIATILGSGGGGGGDGGTTSGAPVLVNVVLARSSAAAGLTITIDGQFTFSDADGNLGGGSFNYTYGGTTYSIPLPAALTGITGATVAFQLQAILDSSTGTALYPAWLVDAAGLSSNIFQISFTQLWTRQFGTALEDIGQGIAIDATNHVLVAGTTLGNLDGETNPGGASAFVTRYAPDTTRAWTRVFGSGAEDAGRAVARDGTGNVYVVGHTQGTSFDGETADGTLNAFLTKFNASGVRQWTKIIGQAGSERAYAVATDGGGNVYVAGETTGDLDGETNMGSWDAFLVKYDSGGIRQWTRLMGGSFSDTAYGVAVDSAGNAYVTGASEDTLGGTLNFDAFVAGYAADGAPQWFTRLQTPCTEWANGIALASPGYLYVVGKIYQCAFPGNIASGGYDAFIAYFDTGATVWVKQFGTTNHDSAQGVATDSAGNAYVTGFLDSVYFNDDNEGHALFLARYDTAGSQAWLAQDAAGTSWGNQGRAAALDASGNIFFTGMVHGALDGHVNASPGEDDVFILKYDASGNRR